MTGYTEGVYKNWGWRNQTQKRQEKKEAKKKTTAQQTTQPRESRLPPCHRKTMVLWATTAALFGHWVWRWLHSHTTLKPQPHGCCWHQKDSPRNVFSALLLHPTGRAKGQISSPAKKGASRKGSKTRGNTLQQHHMERLQNEIRCWQQKINICLIHTLYQV